MKILHFELFDKIGGIESLLLNIYSVMDREQYHCDFVTTVDHPGNERQLLELGAEIYKIPKYSNIINNWRYLKALFLNCHYDIIHFNKNSAANILPILCAKKYSKAKIVIHSHSTNPSVGKSTYILHHLCKKYLNDVADYKIACSEDAGKWMFYGKYNILQNGIRTEQYRFSNKKREIKRNELKIKKNDLVIGHVGKFMAMKNHEHLVHAFYYVYNQNIDSKLLLIGIGELQEKIKQLVNDLGLSNAVLFLNEREDISDLLCAMDVFVMPSFFEGLGIACVEAQASGLPTLLSSGIVKEAAVGETVEWFDIKQSYEKTADGILGISKKYQNYKRDKAFDIVKEKGFDIRQSAKKLQNIYDGVISK